MSLQIPGVGTEAGPAYALDINASLTLIDAHDHTPGKGAPITAASININTDLSFNNNNALSLKGLQFTAQTIVPPVNTLYQSGSDLYFVDGIGNNIRLTTFGSVAGTPGSIANLVAPASASYVAGSSVFVWQSNINRAANMDFGSAILRNLLPNSTFSLTLQPPPGMSSNTAITLPVVPAVPSFLQIDNAGIITNTIPIQAGINTVNIAPNAIITSKITDLNVTTAKLADQSVTTAKIADGSVTAAKLASGINKSLQSQTFTFTSTFTVPAGVTLLTVNGCGGGHGGASSSSDGLTPGLGGANAMPGYYSLAVTPGQVITATIGGGGAGGSGSGGGNTGGTTQFSSCTFFGSNVFSTSNDGTSSAYSIGGAYTGSAGGNGGSGSGGGGGGIGGAFVGGAGGSGILTITWIA